MRVKSWSEFKTILDNKKLGLQFVELEGRYDLSVVDGSLITEYAMPKNNNSDQVDFETNYKSTSNIPIGHIDADTGGMKMTNKFAPSGWLQRLHEIEFKTSTVGGAIHDKDYNNLDTGWSSIDNYELIADVETLMISPTQTDLDTKCIRSDFKWMPKVDYMVLSGVFSQFVEATEDFYIWGLMLDAGAIGIGPIEVLGGGLNLKGLNAKDRVGLKGVSGSTLYNAGVMTAGGFIDTPPQYGTNRIRFICRHPAGLKHRLQAIFEIFRP